MVEVTVVAMTGEGVSREFKTTESPEVEITLAGSSIVEVMTSDTSNLTADLYFPLAETNHRYFSIG